MMYTAWYLYTTSVLYGAEQLVVIVVNLFSKISHAVCCLILPLFVLFLIGHAVMNAFAERLYDCFDDLFVRVLGL